MDNRIGVIAILVEDRRAAVPEVNALLSEFGDAIIGRIGLPYREKNLSIIAIIVEGSTDSLGALTGRLGMIRGVRTKSLLLTK